MLKGCWEEFPNDFFFPNLLPVVQLDPDIQFRTSVEQEQIKGRRKERRQGGREAKERKQGRKKEKKNDNINGESKSQSSLIKDQKKEEKLSLCKPLRTLVNTYEVEKIAREFKRTLKFYLPTTKKMEGNNPALEFWVQWFFAALEEDSSLTLDLCMCWDVTVVTGSMLLGHGLSTVTR